MARELIMNVDDIGIHEGAVEAAIETISLGVAASGSVMVLSPGAPAALEMLADRPNLPVGVHLTLIAESPKLRWSPLTAGPSIQQGGWLLGIEQRQRLMARADVSEVKAEFRAQIEATIAAGIEPTHLDWHCLAHGGRDDIFDVTLELAEEYGTGIRAWTDRGRAALRARGRVAQDQPFLDSFALPLEQKQDRVVERIRAAGRTERVGGPPSPADRRGPRSRCAPHGLRGPHVGRNPAGPDRPRGQCSRVRRRQASTEPVDDRHAERDQCGPVTGTGRDWMGR